MCIIDLGLNADWRVGKQNIDLAHMVWPAS